MERKMITRVIDLGVCMARLDSNRRTLTIVSPSDIDETGYSPAESVVVYRESNLIALRDLLNEAYQIAPSHQAQE